MADNTSDPANSAALTAQERNTLENVDDGYSLKPTLMRSALIEKGVIVHDEATGQTTLTELGEQALAVHAAPPVTGAGKRGNDPKARQRVIEIIGNRLTELFEDYLGEDMGENLLTEYDDGFLVIQLTSDIDEAINQWATMIRNPETLKKLVYDCCEDYLEDDSDEY